MPGWRNWLAAQDLKSCDFGHAGSTPAPGTNKKIELKSLIFL